MLSPVLFLLGYAPIAAAQEARSPVARCADAASGTEVEVCLLLAAEHPDEVDGIAAALRAHINRRGSSDQDLLLALLALIDDGTATDAAARMAELADSRALPALVACAQRREIPIAGACLRAQAAFPAGVDHLKPWLVAESEPLELRELAAETLGALGTSVAADALIDALRRPRLSPLIRRTILDTIRTHYPSRVDDLDSQVASDGRAWLAFGGGWGMGYAMGAAGYYGQTDLASLGWVTGAVGGSTAGWLYGRAWPMEAGDAAYIATGGVLGTTAGMWIGSGIDDRNGDALYGAGLVGMALGYSATTATWRQHQGTGGDSAEAVLVSTLTATAALSAAEVGSGGQRTLGRGDPLLLATGIGLASGAVLGHAVAPRVALRPRDAGLIGLASGWGLAAGALVPIGGARRGTLPVLGVSAGGLLGYALAGPVELPADVQGAALAGAVYAGTVGAGLGMLIDPESDAPQGLALALGTAGMLGSGALAHSNPEPLDDRDIVLVALATGFAGWQSAGWAGVSQPGPRATGAFVLAPAALGAATALVTPALDVPVPQAVAAMSVGFWGAYGGGVAAELTGNNPLSWALVGSDIGLAGGALVMSPLVGAPPVAIGVADAGGVVGGSVAALGAAFATENTDAILTASLVGVGVGFATGAAIGAGWKKGGTRDLARRPIRLPGRWTLRPDMGADRVGMAVDVSQW